MKLWPPALGRSMMDSPVGRLWSRDPGSGPVVARLFHRLLALIFLVAWLSLASQVQALIGSRGLLPIAAFLDRARAANALEFHDFPTLLWWHASDGALTFGVWAGVLLSLLALAGAAPRVASFINALLYLSFAVAGRTFFSFQWDNLLIECGALALLLPRGHRSRAAHLLFRLVLFKLYWESGLAKWQSQSHDWRLGTAMISYYETAPLPTAGAWFAYQLPAFWHALESWLTLVFELILPFAIFGTRTLRRLAFALLTLFQVVNALTANYGFFCHLALALHLFLLEDSDLSRLWIRVRALARRPSFPVMKEAAPSRFQRLGALLTTTVVPPTFLLISVGDALAQFTTWPAWSDRVAPLYEPYRLVNTYHLFGSITTERIEPELQTFDGANWTAHDLRHKPGNPARRPDYVAPHQPRLDFQLWFYGLSFQYRTPEYVQTLLQRMCGDPSAVASLFDQPLPEHPTAVRIAFWQYHFTTSAERASSGNWWKRSAGSGPAYSTPLICSASGP